MKIHLIFILLIVALSACVYPRGWHMMDWGYMHDGYGGILMWIIFLILIGVFVYLLLRGKVIVGGEEKETSLEILKKRYARGELSKDDFERMRRDLE